MKAIAHRVGLAALGVFVILTIDAIEELLFPRFSIFTVHAISMSFVAALTFIVLWGVVPHRDPTLEHRRQPDNV